MRPSGGRDRRRYPATARCSHRSVVHAGMDGPLSRDLVALVQIVDRMEDGIRIRNLNDRPIRENTLDALREDFPVRVPQKSSHIRKPPRSKYSRRASPGVGQIPFTYEDGIEPRIVINIVAVVQVDRLFNGTNLKAKQSPDGQQEVPVGSRVIIGPARMSLVDLQPACRKRASGMEGYINRAKTHSVFSLKSGGSGIWPSWYSSPGYCRNGRGRFRCVPRIRSPHPARAASLGKANGTRPRNRA